MSSDRSFEEFIDEILDADFEIDDLRRVVDSCENGIDKFDAEKLLADFCAIRYKYAFMYLAFSSVYLITKPKQDYVSNMKHIKRAMNILSMLKREMKRLQKAIEESKEEEDGKKD